MGATLEVVKEQVVVLLVLFVLAVVVVCRSVLVLAELEVWEEVLVLLVQSRRLGSCWRLVVTTESVGLLGRPSLLPISAPGTPLH
jgi:hypothetical protein